MDMTLATIDELKDEIERLNNLVKYLREENNHLKDENAKLLIDVAFFDGRMQHTQKGT
jgi:regulator of replication initiation timing